jgi:hypothetical protein
MRIKKGPSYHIPSGWSPEKTVRSLIALARSNKSAAGQHLTNARMFEEEARAICQDYGLEMPAPRNSRKMEQGG